MKIENLSKRIQSILESEKIQTLYPIQSLVIPILNKSKDVIAQSPTGSGKTLSFVIPIAEYIFKNKSKHIQAVIVAPTRELAVQIFKVIEIFDIQSECYIGGTDKILRNKKIENNNNENVLEEINEENVSNFAVNENNDIANFINIIVGTPGRLAALIKQNPEKFKKLQFLILDESDKLLSMGFFPFIENIANILPKQRITALFTATIDDSLKKLGKIASRNPEIVKIEENIPEGLSLEYIVMKPYEKLFNIFEWVMKGKCVVFFSCCAEVEYFYELFMRIIKNIKGNEIKLDKNLNLYKMHGKIKNEERQFVYENFYKDGSALFCTDLAARGIDFQDVEFVINFDVPLDPSNFIHRSGRTARNGKEGRSILFLMENERNFVKYLKIKNVEMIEHNKKDESEKNREQIEIDNNLSEFMPFFAFSNIKALFDENLLRLAVLSFISYIRSYKEYCLSYIFNLKEINFDSTIALHFLDKVPQMNELQSVKFKRFPRIQNKTKKDTRNKNHSNKRKKENK